MNWINKKAKKFNKCRNQKKNINKQKIYKNPFKTYNK